MSGKDVLKFADSALCEFARHHKLKVKSRSGRSSFGPCLAHYELYQTNIFGFASGRYSIDIIIGRESSYSSTGDTGRIYSPEATIIVECKEYHGHISKESFLQIVEQAYQKKRWY